MHEALTAVQAQLEAVVAAIYAHIGHDEPLSTQQGNWSFPGLKRGEIAQEALDLIHLIENKGLDDIGEAEALTREYVPRLAFLASTTIPHMSSNAGQAVPAYFLTLQGLRRALKNAVREEVNAGHAAEAVRQYRSLTQKFRGMEHRLNGLAPRTEALAAMVKSIEDAHAVADQLPDDMQTLTESRQRLEALEKLAVKDHAQLVTVKNFATEVRDRLLRSADEAKAVLADCGTAYSAATSKGLAAAFTERSKGLAASMWLWVVGLMGALVAGSYFGTEQLRALSSLFSSSSVSTSVVVLNLFLAVLSVAAPVWFAWLATKQVGQRFRLSEDYAFKASISRAYEGFRKEAARVDDGLERKLLESALLRLDELPLRLVEPDTHGSPWHELANSQAVKQAMAAVPGFAEQVKVLAGQAVNAVAAKKPRPVTAPEEPV